MVLMAPSDEAELNRCLRLALIENLRRISARIAIDRINQNLALWQVKIGEPQAADRDPSS